MNNQRQLSSWLELDIVEDYDKFADYILERIDSMPRRHHAFKVVLQELIYRMPQELYDAIYTQQINKLVAIDRSLAATRWMLRRASKSKVRLLTPDQQEVAETLLAVVGKKIGQRKKNLKQARQSAT